VSAIIAASSTSDIALLFVEVGVILLALSGLARLARRTGFSPIPLYLVAGLIVAAVNPPQISSSVIAIESQVAVILLLFMLGLEYSGRDIVASLKAGVGAGVADLALNFPPGFVLGLILGWTPLEAALLGGVTYISSSSIAAKSLDDLDRLGNRETPAVLSILVFEDLVMAPYLPLVVALLAGGSALAGIVSVGVALAAVAFALWIAVYHGARLSTGISHASDEVVLLTVVGILLVFSGGAEALHISGAVVAFLLGLAISGALADRARQLFAPIRDLFAAFFFVLFGLQIDIRTIPNVLLAAFALFVVTAVTKLATGWIASRKTVGVPGRIRAGTALVARGEFSIVIAGLGVAAGTTSSLGALAAAYVLITAIAGPLIMRYAVEISRLGLLLARRHG